MKHLPIIATAILLTGCISDRQVQNYSNIKVVDCAKDAERGFLVREYTTETSRLCMEEVRNRLDTGKMTEEQHEQYLLHVEASDKAYAAQIRSGGSSLERHRTTGTW